MDSDVIQRTNSWEGCLSALDCVTEGGVREGFRDWIDNSVESVNNIVVVVKLILILETLFYYGLVAACLCVVICQYASPSKASSTPRTQTTTSPFDLIRLTKRAYDETQSPVAGPWVLTKRYYEEQAAKNNSSDRLSFGPDVYIDESSKRLVLSVRGTDVGLVGHLYEDITLFRDRVKTYLSANREEVFTSMYTKRVLEVMADCEANYPDFEWFLTGHSLGAACCEAAWATDFAERVTREKNCPPMKLWNCVTWESPGFVVGKKLEAILDKHQATVEQYVVHYMGAPNVINCLHPHISPRRRYRIFLSHDSKLTVRHVIGIVLKDVAVISTWLFLLRSLTSVVCRIGALTSNAAMVQRNIRRAEGFVIGWLPTTKAGNEATRRALQVLEANAIAHGKPAIEYLLRQHSLVHHEMSFDVKSGYPRKMVRMEKWPLFEEYTGSWARSSVRDIFIPPSPREHLDPAEMIESKIRRLQGYKEAGSQILNGA